MVEPSCSSSSADQRAWHSQTKETIFFCASVALSQSRFRCTLVMFSGPVKQFTRLPE